MQPHRPSWHVLPPYIDSFYGWGLKADLNSLYHHHARSDLRRRLPTITKRRSNTGLYHYRCCYLPCCRPKIFLEESCIAEDLVGWLGHWNCNCKSFANGNSLAGISIDDVAQILMIPMAVIPIYSMFFLPEYLPCSGADNFQILRKALGNTSGTFLLKMSSCSGRYNS